MVYINLAILLKRKSNRMGGSRDTLFLTFLKRRSTLIMIAVGFTVVIVEGIEHLYLGESLFDSHFLVESLIFGVGVPLFGITLLALLDRAVVERDQVKTDLDLRRAIGHKINRSRGLEELIQLVVRFPGEILPVVSSFLHLANHAQDTILNDDAAPRLDEQTLHPSAEWSPSGNLPPELRPRLSLVECQKCLGANLTSSEVQPCRLPASLLPEDRTRYVLPLMIGGNLTGVLHFDLPLGTLVTSYQARLLSDLASETAQAIERARLQAIAKDMQRSSEVERQRIARDLHDTLGQSITYLRMKLDQLSSQDTLTSIASIRKDLERMRDTANTAYDQVRGTLAYLHPGAREDLVATLCSDASSIGERAGFEVRFDLQGEIQPLPPHIKRQVLYICREALNNIEKHASAKEVAVRVKGKEKELVIEISDNGVGFNPIEDALGGYGLRIMQERAEEINGDIRVYSKPGQGTRVHLVVPIAPQLEGDRAC